MLDSIGPFKKKRKELRELNCLLFFKSRYGIGYSMSLNICNFSGLHPALKISSFLNEYYNSNFSNFYILKRIRYFFIHKKIYLDSFLHKIMLDNINLLKQIKTLKGKRHSSFLPVRGQRNKTNARTLKNIQFGRVEKKRKSK